MVNEKKKDGTRVLVWIFLILFALLIFALFILSHSRVQIAERKALTEQEEKYINTTNLNGTETEQLINEAGSGVAIMIQSIGMIIPMFVIMGVMAFIVVVIFNTISRHL